MQILENWITYLGHVISKNGVKLDPKKLEVVRKFSKSKTLKNIK